MLLATCSPSSLSPDQAQDDNDTEASPHNRTPLHAEKTPEELLLFTHVISTQRKKPCALTGQCAGEGELMQARGHKFTSQNSPGSVSSFANCGSKA